MKRVLLGSRVKGIRVNTDQDLSEEEIDCSIKSPNGIVTVTSFTIENEIEGVIYVTPAQDTFNMLGVYTIIVHLAWLFSSAVVKINCVNLIKSKHELLLDKCLNEIDGKKIEIGQDEEVIRKLEEQIIEWNTELQKHTDELTILTNRLTKMTHIKDEKSHFFTVELKDSKYQLVL